MYCFWCCSDLPILLVTVRRRRRKIVVVSPPVARPGGLDFRWEEVSHYGVVVVENRYPQCVVVPGVGGTVDSDGW